MVDEPFWGGGFGRGGALRGRSRGQIGVTLLLDRLVTNSLSI